MDTQDSAEFLNLFGNIAFGLSVFPFTLMGVCHHVNVVETRKMNEYLKKSFIPTYKYKPHHHATMSVMQKHAKSIAQSNSAVSFLMFIGGTAVAIGATAKIIRANILVNEELRRLQELRK